MYKITCRTSKCTRMQNNQFSAPTVFEVLMQEIQPNEFKKFYIHVTVQRNKFL